MKKIIALAVVIVGVGVFGGIQSGFFESLGTVTATNDRPETPEKEVVIEEYELLDVLIEEAVAEARPAIEAEAQEQYEADAAAAKAAYDEAMALAASSSQEFIDDSITDVVDTVKQDYIAEIEATISSKDY